MRLYRGPSPRAIGWIVLAGLIVILLLGTLLKRANDGGGSSAGGGTTGTSLPSPPPVRPQQPGAEGEWTFDEGLGRAAADTAGGHPMSLQGGADWLAAGQDGAAVHFDGTKAYAATDGPVLDTTRGFALAVWVRLDRLPRTVATVVGQDGDQDSAVAIQYDPADRKWALVAADSGGVSVRSARPAVAGTWTQLAASRDLASGQLTLYVDGVAQNAVTYGGRPDSQGVLAAGRGRVAGKPAQFLPGAVDDLTVYGRALSGNEVRVLYQSGQ